MIIKINLFLFFNIQNNISYGEGKILSLNIKGNRKNLIHDVSTLPGANDELYNRRFRVLNKTNRLSNILLSKRRGYISLIKMIQSNVLLMKLEKLLLGIL